MTKKMTVEEFSERITDLLNDQGGWGWDDTTKILLAIQTKNGLVQGEAHHVSTYIDVEGDVVLLIEAKEAE